MDDTTQVVNAQKARGVDFGEAGNIIQKVRSIIPILIPLLHQALNEQMLGDCYGSTRLSRW